jgi:type I restriction enzyme S subunit
MPENPSLGDSIQLIKGRVPKGVDVPNPQLLPYLTPEYLRGGSTIPSLLPATDKTVQVEDGEIIILCDGSNAGEVFSAREGIVSSTMAVVKFDQRTIQRNFLFHYLKFYEPYLKAQTAGSGIPHLDKELLGLLPAIGQTEAAQNRIAAILTNLNQLITATEAQLVKQQRLRTGLLHDLLTRGLDQHGQLRSEETHEFKDSLLGRIPVEWDEILLQDALESSAYGPRFPGTAYDLHGNVATMRTTDIDVFGNINLAQMPLASLSLAAFKNHLLAINDVLVTRSGTCGIVSVFEGFATPVLPGAFLIRLRLNQSRIAPQFAKLFLSVGRGKKQLLDLAEGAVQKNIRGSALTQMTILLPQLAEQEQILSIFRLQEEEQHKLNKRLAKLRRLKTGLMQDLLTRHVPVGDFDSLLPDA